MHRFLLLSLLLTASLARAQEELERYQCRPLAFELRVPAGWQADQDRTGMVARSSAAGFTVSREPFLHTVKGFPAAWEAQLGAAKVDTRVETGKLGKFTTYRAAWTAAEAGRSIEVRRVYVPANEMLYNFSFSANPGVDMTALADRVLKSFKVAASPPALTFQREAESIATRITIRMPEGYEKQPMGISLGGGLRGGYVKTTPGYKPPHVAGVLSFRAYDARISYQYQGKGILGSDTKKLAGLTWDLVREGVGEVTKKPKLRAARFGGLKGHSMKASVISKDGLPKRFLAFVGKLKRNVVSVSLLVDERETRLYKDYLKQVCSHIEVKK